MTATPTLDDDRTDQLRTFLVVEASAHHAATTTRPRSRVPRLAVGVAAAVLLAGTISIGTSIGGPGAERADAVAIEREGGWTTIRIVDLQADPESVLQELTAAGIDARIASSDEALGLVRVPAQAGVTGMSAEFTDGTQFGVMSVASGEAPDLPAGGDKIDDGLTVENGTLAEGYTTEGSAIDGSVTQGTFGDPETTVPHAGGEPIGPGLPGDPEVIDPEASGLRIEADGAISIRNDAEVRVVIYTAN